MDELQCVDAWRFLLGMDSESYPEGVDVVAGHPPGPLLPQYSSEMITETMAGFTAQDRLMMTISFVR